MTLDRMTMMDEADPAHGADEEAGFGSLETARGGLPLQRLAVDGRITGLLYRLTVNQTFINVHAEPLEATYIFPLPARAGVTRFQLHVGERVIDGVLKERGAARAEYDRALHEGRRAAIAEEERPEVFTVRAGNIPPGETVGVELELVGPLAVADGEATFRFPLVLARPRENFTFHAPREQTSYSGLLNKTNSLYLVFLKSIRGKRMMDAIQIWPEEWEPPFWAPRFM